MAAAMAFIAREMAAAVDLDCLLGMKGDGLDKDRQRLCKRCLYVLTANIFDIRHKSNQSSVYGIVCYEVQLLPLIRDESDRPVYE